jgi:hypothetical protein
MSEKGNSEEARKETVYVGESETSFADAAQKAAKAAFADNDSRPVRLNVVELSIEVTNPITMYAVLKPGT